MPVPDWSTFMAPSIRGILPRPVAAAEHPMNRRGGGATVLQGPTHTESLTVRRYGLGSWPVNLCVEASNREGDDWASAARMCSANGWAVRPQR